MPPVSTSVMPSSSAPLTTRCVAVSSMRPPKLLHPRPTTEASSLPMLRVSIGTVSRRLRRGRFVGGAGVVAREQEVGGPYRDRHSLLADGEPRDHAPEHREHGADAQRD